MVNTLGRLEPDPDAVAGPPQDLAGPPSPAVIKRLHHDFIREKRRALLKASPILLLAVFGGFAAITAPRQFGGLLFLSLLAVVGVGRIAYDWIVLRRADPVALYEREQRQAEIERQEQVDHMLRAASVVPVASLSLAACIVLVTALEFVMGIPQAVVAAGLVKPAVRAGDWWRLLSATYLHGNLLHLMSNLGALMSLGPIIETYERRLRVPAIYLASAIAGSVLSTLLSSKPSIGASGGVLGLAAYLVVVAGRPGGTPVWIRRHMASLIGSTALLGLAAFMFIDNAAHAGGAAAGAAIGYWMRHVDQQDRDWSDLAGTVAACILAVGAIATILRLL